MKTNDDDMLPEYDFAGQLPNSEVVNSSTLRELISPSSRR